VGTTEQGQRPSGLKRALRRITAHETELDADELRDDVVDEYGATPVGDCGDRALVCVAGQIKSVTLKPVGGVPALEADVYDGEDIVTLVFLGRRSIAGIEPGRVLVARGRIRHDEGRALIFNPSYDLRPAGE
jgi:hypothetical protein